MQFSQSSDSSRPTAISVASKSSSRRSFLRPTTIVPDSRWVEHVRLAGVAAFPAMIVFCIVSPTISGRIFWTVAIASLPLFFVLAGYHRWRRVCPLAFVAELPTSLGFAGKKRAGRWLQAHGYRLPFALLLLSLWLRLVATNGDGFAIAAFLVAIAAAAFAVGIVFTGKTWCNYVCPVSFVEKLYTEPRGLRDTPNSQCQKCTACRPTCPDINQENSYWKEVLSADKRYVFFAFPGVVLAFYLYYYVQSGGWEYYFGGRWTHEVGLFRTAFLPGSNSATAGMYFWPQVPRAVGAAATLLLGAGLSLVLFTLAERRLPLSGERDDLARRHIMFGLAAFAAFVTFYSFAGAPTLRLVPGVPHVFQLLVVTTGTLFLVRRIRRRQRDFSEETLARKILAKWPWADTPPQRDLRDAFFLHSVRSKAGERASSTAVELYKTAVQDSVHSGVLTRGDVHRLEALRTKFGIAESDHERIMSEIVEEDRELAIGDVRYSSPEKRLQLRTYADAMASLLEGQGTAGTPPDEAAIRRLREEYRVTNEEHRAVLDHLVHNREGVVRQIFTAPAIIEEAVAAVRSVEAVQSSVGRFFASLLTRRWIRTVDSLLRAANIADEAARLLRDRLLSLEAATRKTAFGDLASFLPPATAARLNEALEQTSREPAPPLDMWGTLRRQLSSTDPYIRATAIYLLESAGEAADTDRHVIRTDEHPLVRETLEQARVVAEGRTVVMPSTLEKMIALRSVSIFDNLEPEDLIRLARASTEVWFAEGQVLCRQGDSGDEVFVVLAGEVSVFSRDAGDDCLVAVQGTGSCIGELSVLDSSPRESTVIASTIAVRALRLDGRSFREARDASPAVADGIIRLLAQRLRAAAASSPAS